MKYSLAEDEITALQNTLSWGHLAPTTPDTLR